MADSNDTIDIKVKVDKSDGDKAIDQLDEKVKGLGDSAIASAAEMTGLSRVIAAFSSPAGLATAATGALVTGLTATVAATLKLSEAGEALGSVADYYKELGGATSAIDAARDASLGLVKNVDLITIANKALVSGLPDVNNNFGKIADAGTRLANVLNQDTKATIESLTEAIAKGRSRQLQQFGILVDQEKAYNNYAKSVGTTVDALNNLEKQEAIQIESLRQLDVFLANTSKAGDSVANSYASLQNTVANATAEFARLLNESPQLTEAIRNLEKQITGSDIAFESLAEAMVYVTTKAFELATDALVVLNGAILTVSSTAQAASNILKDFFAAPGQSKGFAGVLKESVQANVVKEATGGLVKYLGELFKVPPAIKAVATGETARAKSLKEQQKALEEAKKAEEERVKSLLDTASTLADLVSQSEAYSKVMEKVTNGTLSEEAAQGEVLKLYSAVGKATERLSTAKEKLVAALANVDGKADLTAEQLYNLTQELTAAQEGFDKLTTKKAEAELSDLAQALQDLAADVKAGVGSAIGDALGQIFEGSFGRGSFEGIGATFGSTIGQGLGEAIAPGIGGPIGQAIGQKIIGEIANTISKFGKSSKDTLFAGLDLFIPGAGTLGSKLLGGLFGGGNKDAETRKQIDSYFKELFDEKRIGLLIDGQFKEISRIVVNSTETFTNNLLADLDTSSDIGAKIFGGFDAVGTALANLSGVGQEFASQISNALFTQVGGSLDNLRLLVLELGLSFEDLEGAIIDSFLAGELGALEASTALRDLPLAFEAGLVAAGAYVQAMDNLIASAGRGRVAIKSLQDIAIEAQEAQVQNLDQLREYLLASGKYTEDQINKFFTALEQNGITTLEQLATVSDQVGINILGSLEAAGDFFAEFSEGLDAANEKMTQLSSDLEEINGKKVEATVVVNVESRFRDGNAEGAFNELGKDNVGQPA
jgi:hypothetical protein